MHGLSKIRHFKIISTILYFRKKMEELQNFEKKCENSRMLCPVKVFHFVCVFISESNRNTLQICMAHKICHSFIPLKKYLKMFSI